MALIIHESLRKQPAQQFCTITNPAGSVKGDITDLAVLCRDTLVRLLGAAGSPVRAVAAHPGYSATNLQGQTGNATGDKIFKAANALATDADFGARQTLYAAAADIPGDTFIGPRFGMRGPTGPSPRSPLARNSATASALWALSAQLTDTEFRI